MGLLNKLSYPQRLFVWLLGYSLLMVGCFVVFQYHREKEFKAEEIDKQLQLINTYILTELVRDTMCRISDSTISNRLTISVSA